MLGPPPPYVSFWQHGLLKFAPLFTNRAGRGTQSGVVHLNQSCACSARTVCVVLFLAQMIVCMQTGD